MSLRISVLCHYRHWQSDRRPGATRKTERCKSGLDSSESQYQALPDRTLSAPTTTGLRGNSEEIVGEVLHGHVDRRMLAEYHLVPYWMPLKTSSRSLMSVLLTGELRVTPDPEPA